MADDLTDAKATLQRIQGLENHPYGMVLARAVRLLDVAAVRLKQLEDRVAALEAK